jgi:hypothetical protein
MSNVALFSPGKRTPLIPVGFAAMVLFGFVANSASAITLAPEVDQSIIVPAQAALAVSTSGDDWGQSFTVGLAGYLTEIDFQMGRQSSVVQPLQVQLCLANGDLPNLTPAGLLFSGTIAPANVPVLDFTSSFTTSISLGNNAPLVTPGEKLVVLLSTADPNWYEWDNSGYFNSNPYPNGTSIESSDGVNWGVQTNWDFGFQTWVAPVPEPAALLPLGFLMIPAARRLRKFLA